MPEKITRLPGAKASRVRSTSSVAIEDAFLEAGLFFLYKIY
ncbi:MAG: hypothetical protein ACEB74_01995 [Desulfovibrio aminophilus]